MRSRYGPSSVPSVVSARRENAVVLKRLFSNYWTKISLQSIIEKTHVLLDYLIIIIIAFERERKAEPCSQPLAGSPDARSCDLRPVCCGSRELLSDLCGWQRPTTWTITFPLWAVCGGSQDALSSEITTLRAPTKTLLVQPSALPTSPLTATEGLDCSCSPNLTGTGRSGGLPGGGSAGAGLCESPLQSCGRARGRMKVLGLTLARTALGHFWPGREKLECWRKALFQVRPASGDPREA